MPSNIFYNRFSIQYPFFSREKINSILIVSVNIESLKFCMQFAYHGFFLSGFFIKMRFFQYLYLVTSRLRRTLYTRTGGEAFGKLLIGRIFPKQLQKSTLEIINSCQMFYKVSADLVKLSIQRIDSRVYILGKIYVRKTFRQIFAK